MPERATRLHRIAALTALNALICGAATGCSPSAPLETRIAELRAGLNALSARWNDWREHRRLASNPTCHFGQSADCAAERVCAFIAPGESRCFPRYAASTRFLRFPFAPETPVACVQGPSSTVDHHSYLTALYAVDLAGDERPGRADPLNVYAAMEGVAVVTQGTGEFGNHVRLLDPRGYVLLYARLKRIEVADGQVVRTGDVIGTVSAPASGRPSALHFSLNYSDEPVAPSWIETLAYYRDHPGAVPPSVPFETQYCDPARADRCVRMRTRVEELPCGPRHSAPGFRLRADWRD